MSAPVRQCAGCGRRRPQDELVRMTVVDGALAIDGERRLPGRGVYLCPSRGCAERARRKGAIPRRLRFSVMVPPDLADRMAVERPQAAWED